MVYNKSMVNESEIRKSLKNASQEQLVNLVIQMSYRYDNLQSNYDALRRKYYGTNKGEAAAKGQLSLFNEAEETVDDSVQDKLQEPSGEEVVSGKKKKKKTSRNAKLKQVEVEEHPINLDDTACPICGKKMDKLAPTIIEQLEFRPGSYVLVRYIIENYTCHDCNEEKMNCMIYTGDTSEIPARLIDGSIATASVISNMAVNKLLLGLPFHRQEKDLFYRGIEISRQNMCNWMMRAGKDYLEIVFNRMLIDFRQCEVINMDETTLKVLEDIKGGQRSNSYTWLAMSGIHEKNQMALYFYNSSREHKFVYEILGPEFHGVIQSDGYGAYGNYEPASGYAGCSAHCQRKYTEAAQSYTSLYKAYTEAKNDPEKRKELREKNPSFALILHILSLFTLLFGVERRLRESDASPEEILEVRDKEERPYWEEIRDTVNKIKSGYVMSGSLTKAITYTENQWNSLQYYLTDWRVQMDNNLAEREGIKPFVMARKNFIFSDTRSGAKISAVYFSLLISARMNGLNPEKYLCYILTELSTHGLKDDVIERCLPYSKALPDDLKISKSHSS